MRNDKQKATLKAAIKMIGGQRAVAELLGIKQQAVQQWLKNGLPVKRVLQLEKATGGKISRHQLDPVFYPPEQ